MSGASVRSFFFLTTVSRQLAECKSDLIRVQEFRSNTGFNEPADDYVFCYANENTNKHSETGFFVHKETAECSAGVTRAS